MEEITVVGWVDYGSREKTTLIGGLGGWFNSNNIHKKEEPTNMVWQDYLDYHEKSAHPYLEALRTEIKTNNLQITGEHHQYNSCAPLFSDGKIAEFSYRAWGDLMAAIYSTKEKPLDYMEYYM